MTAYSYLRAAVDAIRGGAFDYLTKPFAGRDEVLSAVQRGLQERAREGDTSPEPS